MSYRAWCSALSAATLLTIRASIAWAGAAEPDWSLQLDEQIRYRQLTDAGVLLVATRRRLLGVDLERDGASWSREDLAGSSPETMQLVAGTPVLLVHTPAADRDTPGSLHAVDLLSGEDLWTLDSGPPRWTHAAPIAGEVLLLTEKDGPKGADWIMRSLDLATGSASWEIHDWFGESRPKLATWPLDPDQRGSATTLEGNQAPRVFDDGRSFLELWHAGQGLVRRRSDTGHSQWTTPARFEGDTVPTPGNNRPELLIFRGAALVTDNGSRLRAFDVDTGRPLWKESSLARMPGDIVGLYAHPAAIVLTGADRTGKGWLGAVSGADGSARWRRDLPLKGPLTHVQALSGDRILSVEEFKGKARIRLTRIADGERASQRDIQLPGTIDQLVLLQEDSRALVLGHRGSRAFVGLWDLETGGSLWRARRGVHLRGPVPALHLDQQRVQLVDGRGDLLSFSLLDGEELSRVALPWSRGRDRVQGLRLAGDHLVAWSDRSVIGVDPSDGSVIFERHHEPPPIELLVPAGAAAAVDPPRADRWAGDPIPDLSHLDLELVKPPPSLDVWEPTVSLDQAQALNASLGSSGQRLLARLQAMAERRQDYLLALTRLDQDQGRAIALQRINLLTGRIEGTAAFDERRPDGLLDEPSGTLLLVAGGRELRGWTMGAGLVDPNKPPPAEPGGASTAAR